jgi:FK506-binding protein 2
MTSPSFLFVGFAFWMIRAHVARTLTLLFGPLLHSFKLVHEVRVYRSSLLNKAMINKQIIPLTFAFTCLAATSIVLFSVGNFALISTALYIPSNAGTHALPWTFRSSKCISLPRKSLYFSLLTEESSIVDTNKSDNYDLRRQSIGSSGGGRRRFLQTSATVTLSTVILTTITPNNAVVYAAVVDATDIFANNDWSTSSKQPPNTLTTDDAAFQPTDEVPIRFQRQILREQYNGRLGLELVDIEFRTNIRVRVQSVQTASYAAVLGVQPNWIVVAVNGISTERTNAAGVRQYVSESIMGGKNYRESSKIKNDEIVIVFRDPSIFSSKLRTLSSTAPTGGDDDGLPTVTTQVAPAGDTTQRNTDGTVRAGRTVTTARVDQRVTVQQLQPPRLCSRGATTDDLMEISYTGSVVETGLIFDGSAVLIDGQGIPGRGNDVSLFFVLGKQPFGQFPPGWDVGLVGMCVGERRRLTLPPALGYGSTGMPRRNIPPNATLQYDITLVSLNGLATPQ